MNKKVRAIAFYLPQFHPIPENDDWWGKGFTEWTNVTKAKPLFRGHEQPKLPSDLGFYDLRLPEAREAQAELARKYGVEGFCYWHYWFGNGKRILEGPFNDVLRSGEPGLPFCLAWANESWTGIWHGMNNKVLAEQTYPGKDDYTAHFYEVLPAFKDPRYITLDGKPVFLVYRPHKIPNPAEFTALWRELAAKEGLPGIHFIGVDENRDYQSYGFDGVVPNSPTPVLAHIPKSLALKAFHKLFRRDLKEVKRKIFKHPRMYEYSDFVAYSPENRLPEAEYPVILPGWDNTPRSSNKGLVLLNNSVDLFKQLVKKAVKQIEHKPVEHRLLFIKSWNEWAEGNYMEPDRKQGHAFLQAFKEATEQ